MAALESCRYGCLTSSTGVVKYLVGSDAVEVWRDMTISGGTVTASYLFDGIFVLERLK